MFVSFFLHLRAHGVPVTLTELLALLEALERGLIGESLERLYVLGRGILVKRVEHFDLYDQAFASYFGEQPFVKLDPDALTDEVLSWLEDPKALRELSEAERAMLRAMELDELRRQFEERLKEQTERHDGGSRWVGTGGTSPFGHGGEHPSGIRVGGQSGRRSAVQVATARRFSNLRQDMRLDVRQLGVALRKLRALTREGREDELDVDGSIDATAQNAGDLELVWRAPRKNNLKLLLLMDVGGSMTPHAQLCSRLFTAAHQASHFRAFKSFYFHNCPYDHLYTDMDRRLNEPTREVLDQLDASWTCIIVGDAAMAPGELMYAGGSLDLYEFNERAGIDWLRELKHKVPNSVWLNPDPVRYWPMTYTTRAIGEVFEMFPLTLDGLDDAVRQLRRKRAR